MNLRQIAAFKELMLTGSVSEAARNLNRTQPSISHLIATLESEIGMKLFKRRSGRLHPVPEAYYLLEESKGILSRLASIDQNMQRMKNTQQGELHIVSMQGPSVFFLPNLIADFVNERPDISVMLQSHSSDAVLQLIESQQFDLGLYDYQSDLPANSALIQKRTFLYRCQCAIKATDPLASKEVITAEDLSGKPMGLLNKEHMTHQLTQAAFAAQRSRLVVRFMTQYFLQQLAFVEKGNAYAIIDPLTMASYELTHRASPAIVFRPFIPAVEFGLILAQPNYRPVSKLAEAFTNALVARLLAIGGEECD